MYHIRVLIPCYKEELHIVQKTLNAIREAALPAGELMTRLLAVPLAASAPTCPRHVPHSMICCHLALTCASNARPY
jgi:hypothetical protein